MTLKRFFIIHFFLGLFISVIVLLHILFLHEKGSSSSKGDNVNFKVNFIPLFSEETVFAM
jgi:quinol-cytochrome oxidoreductase complex cytochrome b subunit